MSQNSKIEWTEYTWNPVTGCTKISAGCSNCYAERMAKRLHAMGNIRYANGFQVTLHNDLIERPLSWNKPRVIFVNSMSDLFHEKIPVSFIKKIFKTMNRCPHHTFQVLTKRAERLAQISQELKWTHNIWMGVTVENSANQNRIDHLASCGARVKFLSCEPLLGYMPSLPLEKIDWVIAGGESGPRSRAIEPEWVISIRDQCLEHDIPYFFKQWGGWNKKHNGNILEGKKWEQMPMLAHEITEISSSKGVYLTAETSEALKR